MTTATKNIRYDTDLLRQICERDKCTVDFDKIEKPYCKTRINFICHCGTSHNKTLEQLYKYQALCTQCIKSVALEKKKMTCLIKYGTEHNMQSSTVQEKRLQNRLAKTSKPSSKVYNKQLLEEICERDKCTVDFDKIETYMKNSRIDFVCSCGNQNQKELKGMLNQGGFCKPCMKILSLQRQKQACFLKYGTEHTMHCKEIKEKAKQTNLRKFGVANVMQSETVKEKNRTTCLKKYGKEYTLQTDLVKNKAKETWLKKHNVPHIRQSEHYKQQFTATCQQRYNVDHHSQDAEISEKQAKNAYKNKPYIFPCGTTVSVQGYEPFLLDILVTDGYAYQDIITQRNEVPVIWYTNNNGKKSRYFCDMFIPKTNTIYEVKSTWTYKNGLDTITLKKQACEDAGYNFELYIFDKDGNTVPIPASTDV
jgi:hypothetical protein